LNFKSPDPDLAQIVKKCVEEE